MSSSLRIIAISIGAAAVGFYVGFSPARSTSRPAEPGAAPAKSPVIERDPVGAAFAAMTETNSLRLTAALSSATASFTPELWRKLVDQTEGLAASERNRVLPLVVGMWAQLDPRSATAWISPRLNLLSHNPYQRLPADWSEWAYVHAWASNAPDEALAYARNLPSGAEAFGALVNSATARRADGDFAKGFEALRAVLKPGDSKQYRSLINLWAQADRDAAFAAASSLPPGRARSDALGGLLQATAKDKPGETLQLAAQHGITDTVTLAKIFDQIADGKPALAAAWLEQNGAATEGFKAQLLATTWAQHDPAAALAWARAHGLSLTTPLDRSAVEGMFNSKGESPFDAALVKNPAATLAFIEAMPPGDERTLCLERAFYRIEDLNLASALLRELPPDAATAAAAQLAVHRYRMDKPDALDWVGRLTGEARQTAWMQIGAYQEHRGSKPPPELPPGPDRDAFLSGEATSHAGQDSTQSLERAAQIADPTMRRETFEYIFGELQRSGNPAAIEKARAWLKQSSLPEDWRPKWN